VMMMMMMCVRVCVAGSWLFLLKLLYSICKHTILYCIIPHHITHIMSSHLLPFHSLSYHATIHIELLFSFLPSFPPFFLTGVYRGHFRMDQMGENLNRYYGRADPVTQPSIFAATSLIEHYASNKKLCFYLDLHAHASKRGCFIYGNVLDDVNDQIQNQLYCKLVSMNTAHFEYEACLFSREHMKRTDPGDMHKGQYIHIRYTHAHINTQHTHEHCD
jgi:hypothetical protein